MPAALGASLFTLSLTVDDLERSLRFYVDGLGFTLVQRFEDQEGRLQGGMLKGGTALLGLTQDDFARGRDRVKGVGMRLFVETPQDIDELARQAVEAGLAIEGPMPLPWGPIAFSATDPDGFAVTISAPQAS